MPLIFSMHMTKSQIIYAQLLCPCDKLLIGDEYKQAGTFCLVIYIVLLLASSPSLWRFEVLLCNASANAENPDLWEWSAKKRDVFLCFLWIVMLFLWINMLFLNSLKAEKMFYGKALVLLNIFMSIGVLGNDCSDWRQFYTSVLHMMWAPYLIVFDPMSRRPTCWFFGGDTKSKLSNTELTACMYAVVCSVFLILIFFQE